MKKKFKAAVRPGMGTAQMSVVMRNLMKRLGFEKFYVQGGDWGSIIGGHLVTLFPEVSNILTNIPIFVSMLSNSPHTYILMHIYTGPLYTDCIRTEHYAVRLSFAEFAYFA